MLPPYEDMCWKQQRQYTPSTSSKRNSVLTIMTSKMIKILFIVFLFTIEAYGNFVDASGKRQSFPLYNVTQFVQLGVEVQNPSILNTSQGYFAYGTNEGPRNVPVVSSQNISSGWSSSSVRDALPTPGSWVCSMPAQWSPDVSRLNSTTYIMYYSAHPLLANGSCDGRRCIGVAYSNNPTGGFVDNNPSYWFCGNAGAIAPNAVIDGNNRYVVFKNGSLTPAGTNTVLQEVDPSNGYDMIGAPSILINQPNSEPGYEGQAIVRTQEGYYLLLHTTGIDKWSYQIWYNISSSISSGYQFGGLLIGNLTSDMQANGTYSNNGNGQYVQIPGGPDFVDGQSRDFVFFGKNSTGQYTMYFGVLCLANTTC